MRAAPTTALPGTQPLPDRRALGWGLAGGGMLLVSTDSVFIRAADFDAWTIAFVFGVASAISLGGLAAARHRPVRGQPLRPLAAVAALGAVTQLAFTGAVNSTSVANVVVIVAATPVTAAVMAWVALRERTEPRVVAAIAAVVAGVLVVVSGSIGTPTLDGDLLAVAAIVAFSMAVVIWRKHPELDRPLALALSSATMALLALPFASVVGAPTRVFVAIGAMGLLVNPLGRIAYTSAPRYAPVSEVALFTPVETVAATVWAWWFFDERPGARTVVGGVIVLVAVVLGTAGRRRRPTPA